MAHIAKIRRRRTSSRLKRRLAVVAWLGVAGGALLLALSVLLRPAEPQRSAPAMAAATPAATPAVIKPASMLVPVAALKTTRRVYPYSIVPGGVSDRGELLRMIQSDKVVATHYASFDASKVRAVTVTTPRAVYVSYRKGDKVYWTARKLMLAQGETLLSDGSSEIRTRCGNRISDVPQLPVEVKGPTPEELDSSVEEQQDPPVQAGLALAAFGIDEIGDMPSFAGQLPTSMNGSVVAQASAGSPSRGMVLAGGLGASPVPVAGWSPFGVTSRSPAPGGTRTPAGTSTAPSGNPESPPDTGASAPGGTPVTPTVLAPAPTQSDGGTGSNPEGRTDPVSTTPDTPPAVPPTVPEELLSPPPFPDQTRPAAPKPANVPEPSTIWLGGPALAAMLLLRRKIARKGAAAD
jgi:hypothetical protein